jgi:drug/metabolite transporter (DMT)-like permease
MIDDRDEPSLGFTPSPYIGRVYILGAVLLWSTNGLFAKAALFHDWPADRRGIMLAFWRALFAGIGLLPLVRRPQFSWNLVPPALFFTIMSACFLQSMTFTTTANAIWLQSTAPLWIFVYGRCFWREPFDRRDLIVLVTGMLGAGWILYHEFHAATAAGGDGPLALGAWGVILGLASGAFYALVVMSLRRHKKVDSAWLIAWNLLVSAILMVPYVFTSCPAPSGQQVGVLAAFGLFQMGLPYFLFARGLRHISSQEGSGIGMLEPVLAPVWVFLRYDEQPADWTIVGATLILLGLLLRYARR